MGGTAVNIGVVSPWTLTRKGLCALLAPIKEARVVLDVDSALENFELIQKSRPDILLLDILSPASDLEIVSQVRKLFPETRIILLVDDADEEFQLRAIRAGARGCVSKRSEPQVLVKSLKVVGQGEIWVSHHMASRIIGEFMRFQDAGQAEPSDLTQREWEILALVANGCRNKEIASRLFISENTIKTHLYAIYKKLQVSNRLGAALYYFHQARQEGDRLSGVTRSSAMRSPDPGPASAHSPLSVKPDRTQAK